MKDQQIVAISGYTLMGFSGTPPLERGNCMTVECSDSKSRKVVNFNYENLEALQLQGLTLPIEAFFITDSICKIDDTRIGERWYPTKYCEVCCPVNFLPAPQQDKINRDYKVGRRVDADSIWVKLDHSIKTQFP